MSLCAALLLVLAVAQPQQPKPPMIALIERYNADRDSVQRFYNVSFADGRFERLGRFYSDWRNELEQVDFDALDADGRIDYVLFRNHLSYELSRLGFDKRRTQECDAVLPFRQTIAELEEARWRVDEIDPREAARTLDELTKQIEEAREGIQMALAGRDGIEVDPILGYRSSRIATEMRATLERWFRHYDGFKPLFGWWCRRPYEAARRALTDYEKFLRETVAGVKEDIRDPLIGDPIGAVAILEDLKHEMIVYGPEDLIRVAEREYAWCEAEMKRAANELGYGDDWMAALEYVKTLHVPPGEQDDLVARQSRDAIAFVDERDLVTVEELCRETWRVDMLTPEAQRRLPFAAYGGQTMLVGYPTEAMDHQTKEMAMRGNNIHFSRIVTPHELIPGHHLQGYMSQRYNPHRRRFSTPFYGEGWCLHWETLLWDLDYARGPEDRIGMLFWRMHRCARIMISLKYHMGLMEPREMIDFLVERVGHEEHTATSEVRRYIGGDYSPLYQCAYMIGGIQIRELYKTYVGGGRMTPREFHDAVLKANSMPIELIRATLAGDRVEKDFAPSWRFLDGR